ncbi:MAG: hypothetical protein LBT47_03245 [Deltaproteobacteria bacterium]|nr:hypothetical protein [Deltaproteobacteria bacterium]
MLCNRQKPTVLNNKLVLSRSTLPRPLVRTCGFRDKALESRLIVNNCPEIVPDEAQDMGGLFRYQPDWDKVLVALLVILNMI